MPVAPAAIGLFDAQRDLLARQGFEFEAGIGADAIDLGPQGLVRVHTLGQREAFDHQGAARQRGF